MNRKMTLATTIDPEAEFPKVENMLHSLAWATAKKCPGIFEEAKAEAYWAFMRACNEYNPAKTKGGKFSSWCYFRTWTHLKTWVTKRMNDRLCFVGDTVDWETGEWLIDHQIHHTQHSIKKKSMMAPATVSSHVEFIEDLSDDAKEIISLLTETPSELIGIPLSPKRFMKKVKEYLVEQGKDRRRVERAHEELRVRFQSAWA